MCFSALLRRLSVKAAVNLAVCAGDVDELGTGDASDEFAKPGGSAESGHAVEAEAPASGLECVDFVESLVVG